MASTRQLASVKRQDMRALTALASASKMRGEAFQTYAVHADFASVGSRMRLNRAVKLKREPRQRVRFRPRFSRPSVRRVAV